MNCDESNKTYHIFTSWKGQKYFINLEDDCKFEITKKNFEGQETKDFGLYCFLYSKDGRPNLDVFKDKAMPNL